MTECGCQECTKIPHFQGKDPSLDTMYIFNFKNCVRSAELKTVLISYTLLELPLSPCSIIPPTSHGFLAIRYGILPMHHSFVVKQSECKARVL
jgi:hypothetical protein